jgi:alginate O-acetyltransferase complex protein AlgI
MVFNSITFLCYFLPLSLLLYYGALRVSLKAANATLFLLSLLLYFWGEREYLALFLASMLVNYVLACCLAWQQRWRKAFFIIGVALNLGTLAFFKYAGFLADTVYAAIGGDRVPDFFHSIRLPLGISFFTFHGLSYLFDIYRGAVQFRAGVVKMGLYIALFPQLIAGPIVRYKEIAAQFDSREHRVDKFLDGIFRFIIGLAKKVLIANQVGAFADYAFTLPADRLGTFAAWTGLVSYTLQIYFDFSGYSDMAIGLGKMFGFVLPENFKTPYAARSVRDFWQRWHITLSTWFRDYLYIPLGGNRGSSLQTARNLCVVFFLCGLWHGASWNFVLWGILHGLFISLERGRFGHVVSALPLSLQHLYTLLVVMLLWVPFRADTLPQSVFFYQALFGAPVAGAVDPYLVVYLKTQVALTIALGIFLASGVASTRRLPEMPMIRVAIAATLLILCFSEIAAGSYNPFIYFRF